MKSEQVGISLFKVATWIGTVLVAIFSFLLIIPTLTLLGVMYILGYISFG